MKKTLFTASVLVFLMTSCLKDIICINGNGIIETEFREINTFHEIGNSTFADVIYKKADSVSLSIRAESNILEHIVTETVNGKLEIRTTPGNACFSRSERPLITVTSPEINNLELTGSGDMFADYVSGNSPTVKITGSGDISIGELSCTDISLMVTGSGDIEIINATCENSDFFLSGSGDISIKGSAGKGQMRISGSGNILSGEFPVLTATETISGSGDIHTWVVNSMNAVISGSGNIYLKGNPTINQNISGSGRIIKQ